METLSTPRGRSILAVLCLSLLMVVVGNTVLNVAIPTLVRELDATSSELQWMVDSYGLVFAGLLLTCGALGDRFGRKGALTIGLLIFGGASAISAIAGSADQIIATRAVMGLGAALVMPATLSILTNVFVPQQRAAAIAIWAGVAGAGGAIGPVAGGWLLEHYFWGSAFLLNVPIVITAIVAGHFLLPTSSDPEHAPLDFVGAGLSTLGLGTLLYGIIEAPNHGWTNEVTLISFAFATGLLGLFAWWELRTPHPMLDLRLFRNPRFGSGSASITLVFFAMFGLFFMFTQYLQLVRGYSPFQAGVRLLPMAVMLMVSAPLSARWVDRYGPKRVVASGLMIVAAGLSMLYLLEVGSSYWYMIVALVIIAAGMGTTAAPSTTAIMSAMPLGKAGVGSAVNDTTRELGGALGVAVLGSILASQYASSLAPAAAALPTGAGDVAMSSLGGALGVAQQIGGGAGAALAAAARTAYMDGMGVAILTAVGVAVGAAALVYRFMPTEAAMPGEAATHQPGKDGYIPVGTEPAPQES
jgi:EmrB/QacA subfamily drug resistance transporter